MAYDLQVKIENIKSNNTYFDIEKDNRELTELNMRIAQYKASLKKQK